MYIAEKQKSILILSCRFLRGSEYLRVLLAEQLARRGVL